MGKVICKKDNIVRLLSICERLMLLITIGLWIGFFSWMFGKHFVLVNGESMSPTLKNKEAIYQSFNVENIERYNVIIFDSYVEMNSNSSSLCIKRVYGLPGETIQIKDNSIYVNNKKLDKVYFEGTMEDYGYAQNEITLKSDEYFVLGDNVNHSVDSRSFICGVVKKPLIISKALFK